MDYFSSQCDQKFHVFARDGEDHIQAYHVQVGDTYVLCELADFSFSGLFNEELDRLVNCPWCDKTVEESHIRKCSGYHQQPTINEIIDAYSEPCESAKRDSLLRDIA